LRRIVPWLLATLCSPLWSQQPVSTLEQLNHWTLRAADGVPVLMRALAQTADGTLWIGGHTGLNRFDGVHFVRYPGPSDEPLPSTGVSALAASPDGGLWIGFVFGGISLLRDGHVISYGVHDGIPAGSVRNFAYDREGVLWVAATGGLARLRGNRVESVSDVMGTTDRGIAGMFADRAGNVWVETSNRVLVSRANEAKFRLVATVEQSLNRNPQVLAQSPDGHVWITDRDFVMQLDPSTDPPRNRAFRTRDAQGGSPRLGAMLFDSEGNAWFGIYGRHEIRRWPYRQRIADMQSVEGTAHLEVIESTDVQVVILEDREHNIWLGSRNGMERFSRSSVVRSLKPCLGLGYALAPGDAGTLWAACGQTEKEMATGNLLEVRDGQVTSNRAVLGFTAAYRDRQGTVWFGGPTGLGHLEGNTVVTTPMPDQVRGFDVQAIARDAQGGLWVSIIRHPVYRVFEGEWAAYGGLDAMPRGPAIVETVDGRGGIWFGYPDNRIAHLLAGRVQVYGPADGVQVGNITAIYAAPELVLAGGDRGLIRLAGARFMSLSSDPGCALQGASGIVASESGDIWINGFNGIARLSGQELERAVRDPAYRVHCEMLDYLDGVPGTAVQLRPTPSAIATTDGRLWFEMTGGTIAIDPTHLVRNDLAPPVTIWSITSAGKRYPNRDGGAHLPAHTTNVQIDYSAGSYSAPERVRFRYRLEGSDRDWQDAGARREAIYTNLSPGRYRFRVIASNNDAIWNSTGAAINFTIAPTFYQTNWFYALCALLTVGLLAALYRLRIEQVRARTSRLLEARLAERERIARELHDTLLQGMQGLIWRFQAATNRIPPNEPARTLMEHSLERADRLLSEGRDKVKDLRAAETDSSDLVQALTTEAEQLALAHPTEFRLNVEGVRRDLHPIVREEVFLIAREALGNAFRHSGAGHIEVEASYGEAALCVRVRDDGRGIGPDVLAKGKPDRFGLLGMRERSEKLGAELQILSRPGIGTEIDLRVPAKVAYRTGRRPFGSSGGGAGPHRLLKITPKASADE
jgi:signal transduction histidine kinase/ligand-binding sensor domain-containing protein